MILQPKNNNMGENNFLNLGKHLYDDNSDLSFNLNNSSYGFNLGEKDFNKNVFKNIDFDLKIDNSVKLNNTFNNNLGKENKYTIFGNNNDSNIFLGKKENPFESLREVLKNHKEEEEKNLREKVRKEVLDEINMKNPINNEEVYLLKDLIYNKNTYTFKKGNKEYEIPKHYKFFLEILINNYPKRISYDEILKIYKENNLSHKITDILYYKGNLLKLLRGKKILGKKIDFIDGKSKGYKLKYLK